MKDSVRDLINFAREKSPFYQQHYSNVPKDISDLAILPLVNHVDFWAANTGLPPENQVLTSALVDGAVFRTGGTTATPKASFVTREELREGAQGWAKSLVQAGLLPGDRVANLLYGGDLYKGFLDLGLALTNGPVPNFHLSIGVAPLDSQVWTLHTYAATVLIAMPTIMCRLADYLVKRNESVTSIRLLLYVGELLHKDQKVLLLKAFPSAHIGPVQYTSVDAGLIGTPDVSPGSIGADYVTYRVNTQSMIMELVTDADEVITEEGMRGNVVITNLVRRLMPVIRYPMGDLAEWVDYPSRKFRLCGRGAVGVRVGPASYDLESLKTVVSSMLKDDTLHGSQIILRRANAKDEMVFRIASQPSHPERVANNIQEEMGRVHNEWSKEVEDRFVNPLVVEWVSVQDLHYNSRSGKLRDIVDLRCDGP